MRGPFYIRRDGPTWARRKRGLWGKRSGIVQNGRESEGGERLSAAESRESDALDEPSLADHVDDQDGEQAKALQILHRGPGKQDVFRGASTENTTIPAGP